MWNASLPLALTAALFAACTISSTNEPGPSDGGTGGDSQTPQADGGDAGPGGDGGSQCLLSCERDPGGGCACLREETECVTNEDCVVATSAADCCYGCEDALPRALVDSEACLVPRGSPVPDGCGPDREACGNMRCAADCAQVVSAACEAGRCVGVERCPDGTQFEPGIGCIALCTADADCVMATDWSDCCACPLPYHQDHVDAATCISADGSAPSSCAPAACGDVECAGCPGGSPICRDDGLCDLAS